MCVIAWNGIVRFLLFIVESRLTSTDDDLLCHIPFLCSHKYFFKRICSPIVVQLCEGIFVVRLRDGLIKGLRTFCTNSNKIKRIKFETEFVNNAETDVFDSQDLGHTRILLSSEDNFRQKLRF